MKKEKIKRILAFLLAVVFLFSTCLTASPYTVLATEMGTETGTEGTEPQKPSTPQVQAKLFTEVVLDDGVDLVGNVGLGKLSLTIGEESVSLDQLNSKVEVGAYDTDGTYTLAKIESANYEVKAASSLIDDGEDKLLKVTVSQLTPKTTISGAKTVKALATESYSADGAWKDAVTEWKLTSDTAKASITANGKTAKVQAAKGGTDAAFTVEAYAGNVKLAEKNVAVEKNNTSISIETSERESWRKKLDVKITLKSGNDVLRGKSITYSITGAGVISPDNNKKASTDSNGTYSVSKTLRSTGKVNIEVDFAGDDAYNAPATATRTYNPDLENGTLVFTGAAGTTADNPLELTYGTAGKELAFELHDGDTTITEAVTQYTLNYSGNTVSVTENQIKDAQKIVIDPVNASSTSVKLTLTVETENFACTGELYVKVNPCVLTVDTVKGVDGNGDGTFDYKKIYDGTSEIDVKASLKAVDDTELTEAAKKEIAGFDTVVFTGVDSDITAVPDNGNCSFKFKPSATDLKNAHVSLNYTIKDDAKADEDVADTVFTLSPKKLELTVDDTSRAFRSLEYAVKDNDLQNLVSVTGFVANDPDSVEDKIVLPTVVDTTVSGISNIKTEDKATFGEHSEVLELDTTTGDASNNYVFDFESYKKGTLTITEEQNASGYVSISNADSEKAYEAENTTFYIGNTPTVQFTLDGEYNKIYLDPAKTGKGGQDVTAGYEISTDGLNNGQTVTKSFYMEKKAEDGTVLQKTNPFDLTFTCDKQEPQATITVDQSENLVKGLGKMVTFGVYRNRTLTAEITVNDPKLTTGLSGAGVKAWSCYVANTRNAEDLGNIFADATKAEAYLNKVSFSSDNIKNYSPEGGSIVVGELGENETVVNNNYIVFVKVEDNVGNTKIYGSNGIVVDAKHNIELNITPGKESAVSDKAEWAGIKFYNAASLKVNLTAVESGEYYSGLEKMEYTVDTDGKKGTIVVAYPKVNDKGEPVYPGEVTLEKLKDEYCTIGVKNGQEVAETLEVSEDTPSKVFRVRSWAKDNAENACGTDSNPACEKMIVLDTKAPVVTTDLKTSAADGAFTTDDASRFAYRYTNKDVTYTVNVKERFLETLLVNINGVDYTVNELESQKTALGIAAVTFAAADTDITRVSDTTETKLTIKFNIDGKYDVYTTAKDAATNTTTTETERFIIDKVAPDLAVTYKARHTDGSYTDLDVSAGRAYADETVESIIATAVVTEMNFNASDMQLAVTAVNSALEDLENAEALKDTYSESIKKGWEQIGTVGENDDRPVYQLTLPEIQTDANYTFVYGYTDLAGNSMEKQTHELTLDREKPEGTVTVDSLVNGAASKVWNRLLDLISFGYFGKDSVTATLTGMDETAGVAAMQYLISEQPLKKDDLTKKAEKDWTSYTKPVKISADQQMVVYEKLTDRAGNIQYISSDGIVVDNTDPVPTVEITPTTPKWGKGVYSAKDNPGFAVKVTDPLVNGTCAGLKKITYKIVNGTNGHTETGVLADEKTLTGTSHRQEWTGHVNIDPAKFYSNDVRVTVTAEDWSTNGTTSKTATLKVDNKAPVVRFTFDKSDVHNGKYYKNDKKLTITVEERNFDESYMPKVTSSAGGGYKISKWTHHGETHTATITFTKDSDYTVSYDCYDLAGNKSNTEKLEEFTVDKTVPVIKVVYDNNSALNNSYFKAARTVTITVTEHNFDPKKITVTTTASSGGAPKVGGWSTKGDTHTARVSFDHDADYTFAVSGLDLAENKANDYGQDKFTVDLTNPEISITGITDKSANNGTVAPVVTIKDTNFITSGAQVTLTGANRGEMNIKTMASTVATATGMTVSFRNFAKNMDDIYTLTAKSADKAGNETVSMIQFSVNRDGSTYEIGDKTKKLLEKVYTSVPEDIELTEINPNELKTIEISYSLDGKVIKLQEGTDYTVSRSGEEGQWMRYSYTINASCFEAEGTYVINIYSEDAAGNVTTNKTKAKTMEFTVDKTAPTMVVANLVNGGRYTEDNHEFTLNVKDNILLAYVELYMDGELVHTYEGDELTAANGELHINIDHSNRYQTIELVSYDKAGNSSKEVYDPDTNQQMAANYRVLVTADKFVQFINNTPLLIAAIVALAAIVFFIIVLIRRREKNKK